MRENECIQLNTDQNLTLKVPNGDVPPGMKDYFSDLKQMANFLIENANNPNRVCLDEEKLTLTPNGRKEGL